MELIRLRALYKTANLPPLLLSLCIVIYLKMVLKTATTRTLTRIAEIKMKQLQSLQGCGETESSHSSGRNVTREIQDGDRDRAADLES
jgi:hypothetical protein